MSKVIQVYLNDNWQKRLSEFKVKYDQYTGGHSLVMFNKDSEALKLALVIAEDKIQELIDSEINTK